LEKPAELTPPKLVEEPPGEAGARVALLGVGLVEDMGPVWGDAPPLLGKPPVAVPP
jgi:hypothetical protein